MKKFIIFYSLFVSSLVLGMEDTSSLRDIFAIKKLMHHVAEAGTLEKVDIAHLKCCNKRLNTLIRYSDAPIAIIQDLPFNPYSHMIITAARNDNTFALSRLILNNHYGEQIGLLLMPLGLEKRPSIHAIKKLCRGNIKTNKNLNWKDVVDDTDKFESEFVFDIMQYARNPNVKDCNDTALIHHLVNRSDLLERFLTNEYVDPNVQNKNGETLLHIACKDCSSEQSLCCYYPSQKPRYHIVILLLSCCSSLDINLKNAANKTALDIVLENSSYMDVNQKIINLFFQYHPDLLTKALTTAIEQNDTKMTKKLFGMLQNDLDLPFIVELFFSTIDQQKEAILAILLQGNTVFDLNYQDEIGDTILHKICKDWRINDDNPTVLTETIILLLLSKDINLNIQNNDGLTALDVLHLHHISQHNAPRHRTIYKLLVTNGAKHNWNYYVTHILRHKITGLFS